MRSASDAAGFSLGQSDVLRKAMGKKNAAAMQAQREKFVTGAVKNNITEKKATTHLRVDGALRRVRLQQVALDDVCASGLSDGVPEGQLSMAFRRRRS